MTEKEANKIIKDYLQGSMYVTGEAVTLCSKKYLPLLMNFQDSMILFIVKK